MAGGRVITGQKGTRTIRGLGEGFIEETATSKAEGRSDGEAALWGFVRGSLEGSAQGNHRKRDRARASESAGDLVTTGKALTDLFRALTNKER